VYVVNSILFLLVLSNFLRPNDTVKSLNLIVVFLLFVSQMLIKGCHGMGYLTRTSLSSASII